MADTTGTTSNDHLNGGSGDDTLLGLAGNDRLGGGSGNDIVDGGSGSDIVKGDSGNDILIYRVAENVGSTDTYDGGSGIDILRLMLTSAEWARPDIRQDVANYLLFIAGHTLPNGQANNSEFRFTAFDLRVSTVEKLEIYVDGVLVDPHDASVQAVNDSISTNEDTSSLSINLLANDTLGDVVQNVVISQNPLLGSVALVTDFSNSAAPVANVVYTPGATLQSLAVGETATDTFSYTVTDDDGTSSSATVTVTIVGTNDAPLVTAQAGDSAGATLAETNAGLQTTGTLTASDVDTSDVVTVSVVGVAHSGPTGGLTDTQLLSFFNVASGAIDTTSTTSGHFAWNFNSGAQAFNFLAVGETLTLNYTIRPNDGHGPSFVGDGVVTIHITGTNDVPVITSGPVSGTVTEDGTTVLSGKMTAVDPDDGAQLHWTAVGGSAPQQASYHFVMDDFKIIKNGNVFLDDSFSDGIPPPAVHNDASGPFASTATNYFLTGGFTETGGKVILDSSLAGTAISVGTPDPFISNSALLLTDINPADLAKGLKSDDDFTVQGTFDLVIPDDPREVYGIRLNDRHIGGNGTPPDQLGDDLIELVVRKGQDGIVRIQLRELDIVNDQTINIGGTVLNPPPGADQIVLRLTHSTSNVGALVPTFDFLSGGVLVGSGSLPVIGRIFGTETPGFTGDDENWTRAQFMAYAPAITDTTKVGTYGSLTIGQGGDWTYALANNQLNVQNLAAGQSAIDTFTVQVTDEHGASDTEVINITVMGSNDAPAVTTGPVSRTLAEDSALTATGDAFFFDLDLSDTHTITASLHSATINGAPISPGLQAALAGAVTTTLLDAATGDSDGQYRWDFALDNGAVQFLAEGETLTAVYRIAVQDPHSGLATQDVTINITGTNDAPLVTAQAGDSAGATLAETDAGLQSTGTLTASDVDTSDVVSVSVAGVTHSGPTGGLTDLQLLSFFNVASGAIDTTSTTSGHFAWNFNSGAQAFNFLAVGETLTLNYTIRPNDGHGPSFVGDGVVTIHITGTNDVPVIMNGPVNATVAEDSAGTGGIMTAVDPDNGAQKFWSVTGGTPAQAADYHFVMDSFTVTKNGNPFFDDQFSNGIAPPNSPPFANGNPTTYFTSGGFTEMGGKLILDSDGAVPVLSIGTPDPFVGNLALVTSNIGPDINLGLRNDDNFTVEGVFDLIIPDSPREVYGIRLMDRLVGGGGTPPDQLGDDLIELVVRQGVDGIVRVQLRELDIVHDQTINIGGIELAPPAGADQIRLRLTHSTSDVGAVHASFDYLQGGTVVGSQSLAQIGRIFGTETPSDTSDDENWTRAQIVAYAPAITDSTLAGAYGTLTIGQNGAWTYALANNQLNVQNLAAGQSAIDTFTVQVTDEHGASDTEVINITVMGSNDAPVVTTGPVSRTLAEDSALTATGDAFFFDLDLSDTHTITASLHSATINGAPISPGLQAALAGAVTTTLLDAATGDSDGQYRWDFALDNGAVQFLAEGETLTAVYRIAVQDPHSGLATQDVTINITGSDDAAPAAIQRVSVAPNGEANGPSGALGSGLPILVDGNRYVAYYSEANNIVGGDTNAKGDYFLYDRFTDTTERIVAGINSPADGAILSASADGRYLAFNSLNPNLVAGDTNNTSDIFIFDRQDQSYERVGPVGGQGNEYSSGARISGDGNFVAFHSQASNLVLNDTNGVPDAFIYDRSTGDIERILGVAGAQDNSGGNPTSISSDGRYVAFYSAGTSLVTGDTNGVSDTFVYDRLTQTNERVSVATGGGQGNGNSDYASITPDGRFVAFSSEASNLVAGDTNSVRDIFVHDRVTGTTERVSVTTSGAQLNGASNIPTISDDGRFVAFHSTANNSGGDTNNTEDVFVFDRVSDQLLKLSTTGAGIAGNGQSAMATISGDGTYVAFDSFASDLVAGDTNGLQDVFLANVAMSGWAIT